MRALQSLILALLVFAVHEPEPAVAAESPTDLEWFKAVTAKESARLHQLPATVGCDINVLIGPVITRSREPLLKAGDRILAVNSQSVRGTPDTPVQLINALPADATAHLKIERSGTVLNINIPCKSAAAERSALLGALDAAAQGRFAECSDAAADYEKRFMQSSDIYALWRLCEVFANHLTDDQYWFTLVTFWTLHLQELKYRPEAVDIERPKFLTALTGIVSAQQPLLSAEMRRQWKLATGESIEVPIPSPQIIANASPPLSVLPYPRPRRSSSCESGHWVEKVMSDGKLLKLEDGSLWQVDDTDTVDSALWLPSTDIVVCDGKLINTEDNESVEARRIDE
jgi:hypothetical protein